MAQPYLKPVIKTLQILGKEHGTQEAQASLSSYSYQPRQSVKRQESRPALTRA
jgi:hypothetical protein